MTRLAVGSVCAFLVLIVASTPVRATSQTGTHVRVLDASGEAIGGIVLLVNPGETRKSRAYLTGANGEVFLPKLGCEICTVAALDPRGMFFNRTTEFNGKSRRLTLTLRLRPVIDTVGIPGVTSVEMTVLGSRAILPHQKVVVRPHDLTLRSNWVYTGSTDAQGRIRVELLPGKYDVGTLIRGGVWQGSFSIKSRRSHSAGKHSSILEPKPKVSIKLRLSAAN